MKRNIDKQKMKMIIISAAALTLLIAIIVTVACLNVSKDDGNWNDGGTDEDSIGAFAEKTESFNQTTGGSQRVPSSNEESPAMSLVFESNGDGSCTIASVGEFKGKNLIIPAENANGETVSAISDGAFEGCDFIETATIPATVKSIGSGVFAGCSALCDITVNSANTKYCSVGGVLFSRDKTELICYPSAKVGKSYLLSTNVRRISDFAFDGIKNLKSIYYEGSAAKYQAIDVGTGNQAFASLSVTCNYTPAK